MLYGGMVYRVYKSSEKRENDTVVILINCHLQRWTYCSGGVNSKVNNDCNYLPSFYKVKPLLLLISVIWYRKNRLSKASLNFNIICYLLKQYLFNLYKFDLIAVERLILKNLDSLSNEGDSGTAKFHARPQWGLGESSWPDRHKYLYIKNILTTMPLLIKRVETFRLGPLNLI